MKSTSELPHLENSECWGQNARLNEAAFNKQTQTEANEAKTWKSFNPHLAYQYKSRVWKIKHGHKPRVGDLNSEET